jgi:hypothetical protein
VIDERMRASAATPAMAMASPDLLLRGDTAPCLLPCLMARWS